MISPRIIFAATMLASAFCIAGVAGFAGTVALADDEPGQWSWQQTHAQVHDTGDLSWQPQPFQFVAGQSVRYIDYESGDDARSGQSPDTAWKHHPWDDRATGKAAADRGTHTYVFKRGVVYRGSLKADESGQPGNPIRLTSSPDWGRGEAVICGSERVGNWTRGADHKDIPQPQQVWYADLDFAPRCLWMISGDNDNAITRIPLARTPNWTVTDPDNVCSQWWHWDHKNARPFDNTVALPGGRKLHLGIDSINLTESEDYYKGAILWTEHAWVMGGPYPVRVEAVDTKRRGLGFGGRYGGIESYKIARYNRYYLEDKPHYLDDPEGEFWFDRRAGGAGGNGGGGRLYLRLPAGADPNTVHIEAARSNNLIDSSGVNHLHISGLSFRFTNPHWLLDGVPYRDDNLYPACIRIEGAARDIRIANCLFEHVQAAVRISASAIDDVVDQVVVEDNQLRFLDRTGIFISDGSPWGETQRKTGLLHDVRVMRNHLHEIGLRPTRFELGFAIDLTGPQTVEIAGNVIERCYAGGINVHGGKRGGSWRDVPLSRILIHHNKVVDSLLRTDDFGGIETWQGGPAYIFNNVSGNPVGYRNFHLLKPDNQWTSHFAFAYYLDGAFKNYLFNNIAWGKDNDPANTRANRAAFQEIFSFQNAFFNNTAFNFLKGSRRQRPEAGRNKYLGNIFQNISMTVFRHSDRIGVSPNIQDAGQQDDRFDYSTGAYSRNVLFSVPRLIGTFEADGGDYDNPADFNRALDRNNMLTGDGAIMADSAPLPGAADHDFRPAANSATAGRGIKLFVPWALYAEVAEWNFYHAGGNPAEISDEHWYMTPYYILRQGYHTRPRFPLTVVNVTGDDYKPGPLENWTSGALQLNGRNQYATIDNALLTAPFRYKADTVKRSANAADAPERIAEGEELKSPQIHRSSFIIELYFRTRPQHVGGLLIEKMDDSAGYSLAVNDRGGATFTIKGRGNKPNATTQPRATTVQLNSRTPVNDGSWHHLLAEVDRSEATVTLYINGRRDARGSCFADADITLANSANLYLGGSPGGQHLAGAFEFARIALGTLADARTTIEELYAWQFDGPHLRDFTGQPRSSDRPTAGAIEIRNDSTAE